MVNASHFARVAKLLDDPRVSSKVVHGGERDESKLFIAPTLVCDVPWDAPLMLEEIFGPVLPIIQVPSLPNIQAQRSSGSFRGTLPNKMVDCVNEGSLSGPIPAPHWRGR